MIILPAIDIIDGKPVRLYQGDYSRKEIVADDIFKTAKSSVLDSPWIALFSVGYPHFTHFECLVKFIFPHFEHLTTKISPHFRQVFLVLTVRQTGQTIFKTFLQFGQTIALLSISAPHFGHSIPKLYHSTQVLN